MYIFIGFAKIAIPARIIVNLLFTRIAINLPLDVSYFG